MQTLLKLDFPVNLLSGEKEGKGESLRGGHGTDTTVQRGVGGTFIICVHRIEISRRDTPSSAHSDPLLT